MDNLTSADRNYLIRQLGQNDVVLFLGAGFSRDASNRLGNPMPLSSDICREIWSFLRYDNDWDHTPLSNMYEALLHSDKPHPEISHFLAQHLLTSAIPESYDTIARPFWYRIYTTNVDDLLKRVYRRVAASPKLHILGYPRDEISERDQSLEHIQAVFLHGHLPCRPADLTFSVRQFARRASQQSPLYQPCRPADLTFSVRQFARRASQQSPLYQTFVSDYSTRPTIFIGTELNEPLFWQHLDVREQRVRGVSEQRPKSFLVSPMISPPKQAQLSPLNIVPVQASTREFLDWVASVTLPPKEAVLSKTMPAVARLIESISPKTPIHGSLVSFGEAFHIVPKTCPSRGDRSFYLLGATPRWEVE